MRDLTYADALAEATLQAMQQDPNVFIMGEGVDDPKGAFGTTKRAHEQFGSERVFDFPLSENAMTGAGIGAALLGMRPLMVHMRTEFTFYAFDQIVNHAAKLRYMSGGQLSVPIVIRALIGRGWGQAAQHSQSPQSVFAHFPGLNIIMPATPYDAKGLLLESLRTQNPVLCFEHRWLYSKKGFVPEEDYTVSLGKAKVIKEGKDITCVSYSYGVYELLEVEKALATKSVDAEIIDLRSIKPLDTATVIESVKKTGRLLILDSSHASFSVASEISAIISEQCFHYLKAPVKRIGLPEVPTPCSSALEAIYYPTASQLVRDCLSLISPSEPSGPAIVKANQPEFLGPF